MEIVVLQKKVKYKTYGLIIVLMLSLLLSCFSTSIYAKNENNIFEFSNENSPITESDLLNNHGSMMLNINSETGQIISANQGAVNFYGYSYDELTNMKIQNINMLTPEEIEVEMENAKNESRNYFEFKQKLKDGSIKYVEVYSYPYNKNNTTYLFSIIHDVTEKYEKNLLYRKNMKKQIDITILFAFILVLVLVLLLITLKNIKSVQDKYKRSEKEYISLFNNMHEGYALHEIIVDNNGNAVNYKYLKVNSAFEEYTGLKAVDIINKTVLDILPETEKYWIEQYGKVALKNETIHLEQYSKEINKYFSVNSYNVGYGKFITVFIDITQSKLKEEKIEYLSFHDQLTDLYNRRYFEKKLVELNTPEHLPLSIIMADVNGLKLTNDAFGHNTGDILLQETAKNLKSVFRNTDIIARVGGDEFVILLPNTSTNETFNIIKRFSNKIKKVKVGPVTLSVSYGCTTKTRIDEEINEIYQKAEDSMYKNKLLESKNFKYKLIDSIMDQLKLKCLKVYKHSMRLSELSYTIFDVFNLSEDNKKKYTLASKYHDIGKVTFSDSLFLNYDNLSKAKKEEMVKHTEIGYRLLSTINEYAGAAEIVLAHGEWWDGTGFPKGISKTEIPYLARILTIAINYDWLVNETPLANSSTEEIIKELRKSSGKKFDPTLLETFINKVIPRIS